MLYVKPQLITKFKNSDMVTDNDWYCVNSAWFGEHTLTWSILTNAFSGPLDKIPYNLRNYFFWESKEYNRQNMSTTWKSKTWYKYVSFSPNSPFVNWMLIKFAINIVTPPSGVYVVLSKDFLFLKITGPFNWNICLFWSFNRAYFEGGT